MTLQSTRCRRFRATTKSPRSLPSRKPAQRPRRKLTLPLRQTQPTRPRPPTIKRPTRPRATSPLPPLTMARKAKMKVKVQSLDAKAAGSAKDADITLDDAIFGVEPRADILHRVVTWQLTNR